jgi:hypothetical protein
MPSLGIDLFRLREYAASYFLIRGRLALRALAAIDLEVLLRY